MSNNYYSYNYFYCPDDECIINRAGYQKWIKKGYIFLGSWYAHEKTPYINNDGDIVRDRYNQKEMILLKKNI